MLTQQKNQNNKRILQVIAFVCIACLSSIAAASVVVTTTANQAIATISLTNGSGTYNAVVTIDFDNAQHLTPGELNLTATLINPTDPAIVARLPCALQLLPPANICATVDPAFPMLIMVEPVSVPWLFATGFESPDVAQGNLTFQNAYDFEIHTANLAYTSYGPYRLFKAPLTGSFDDVTEDILSGSVRARGRGGAFSQFMIVKDLRPSKTVALTKAATLDTRILASAIDNTLSLNLIALVVDVELILVTTLDYTTALLDLDQLIAELQLNAGTNIANVYNADHSVVNDAGEMLSLAQTLRYTLVRLQNGY